MYLYLYMIPCILMLFSVDGHGLIFKSFSQSLSRTLSQRLPQRLSKEKGCALPELLQRADSLGLTRRHERQERHVQRLYILYISYASRICEDTYKQSKDRS